jgi:ABC-2 type transport system permease protein
MVLSSIAVPFFALSGAVVLKLVHPMWNRAALPAGMLFFGVFRNCAAAFVLLSIQFWLSIRWRSFVLPLAVGVGGILSGIVVIRAPMTFLSLYPWTTPAAAASPTHPVLALLWGMFGGLVLGVAACFHLTRRDEY